MDEANCVSDNDWNATWNDDWKWCEWSMRNLQSIKNKKQFSYGVLNAGQQVLKNGKKTAGAAELEAWWEDKLFNFDAAKQCKNVFKGNWMKKQQVCEITKKAAATKEPEHFQ